MFEEYELAEFEGECLRAGMFMGFDENQNNTYEVSTHYFDSSFKEITKEQAKKEPIYLIKRRVVEKQKKEETNGILPFRGF